MSSAADTPRTTARRRLISRVLRSYLAPHWPSMAVALVCAALVGLLAALLAWLLEPTLRKLFLHPQAQALLIYPLAIAAVGLVRGVAQLIQAVLTNRLGNQLVAQVQVELFGHLLRSDLARLRSAHTGSYVSSVLYDASLIREAATSGLVSYTQNLLTVAGMGVVLVVLDPVLAAVVLVATPVIAWVMRRFVRRTRSAALDAMQETSALSTAVMESLDGIKIVKIENREADEEGRVAAVIARRLSHLIRGANAKALAGPTTDTLLSFVMAAIIAFAGWRAMQFHDTTQLSRLLSFIFAFSWGSQSLRFLANYQTIVAEGLAAAERLFQALDVEPEIADAPLAKPIGRAKGGIRFEDVRFAYSPEAPALEGVTLKASPGQTIALVGPSGGGKSTILNLIPRFYDPQGGRISLDGQDIREVTLRSLRDQIALVTQEPFLFDDTIAANIAYSRPDAPREAIVAAAEAAAAHDFIAEIPGGYDAQVGEAGTRLSGGQRQRIAIARAFLKDAPILLLDEATSALDSESEAKVQAALERLMQGRTTILIAHRLATVRNADVIYVIDRGRVVEQGAHEGLTAQGGLYARLAKSQNLEAEAA
jgi:subfamily B ATP-binding cassette protein MsbA